MKKLIILLAVLITPLVAQQALAAQLRVFVADMNTIGVPNKDEMKLTLQTLLASRLTGDKIIAVGSASEADATVTGTYILIGKVFSMDAMAKTTGGRTLTRSFIQGDSQEDLIGTVAKLADKLSAELVKIYPDGSPQGGAVAVAQPSQPVNTDIIRTQSNIRQVQTGDIIRPQDYIKGSSGGWISKRLPGAANLLAVGSTLPDGTREIFLAQGNTVQYYQMNAEMKLKGTVELKANEKVISLDTVDADGDGAQELYVTIVSNDELASQIWEAKGNKLVRIAADLPYYFRAISLAGGPKKLYVQEMGRGTEDYYGDVYEATRSGASISRKGVLKMPRFGNIFNFNQFRNPEGITMTVVINPDNYLIVYDQDMKEIWRSSDYFGGTALYYQKEDPANVRTTGDRFRWIFLNQRIQVTSKNEVLVGKNDGLFVIGNARNYKKGAVYNMVWDGSSLEERWRTKETQSYMPDYWYDEAKNELLILQMPKKPGPGEDGAASLAIKKVE